MLNVSPVFSLVIALAPAAGFAKPVTKGLGGVVHAAKADKLPAAARLLLMQDESVVVEGRERHFFALYDRNLYEGIPSFISVDAILHVFHVRFDDAVVESERAVALPALRTFAEGQLQKALAMLGTESKPDERLRRLALYHAVPLALLDAYAPGGVGAKGSADGARLYLDPRLCADVDAAVVAIRGAAGETRMPSCDVKMALSFFKPRGHYASRKLQDYFRAFTFYSQCGFDLGTARGLERAADIVRLIDEPARAALKTVRDLASTIVGVADDPGEAELSPLLPKDLPPLSSVLPAKAHEALTAGIQRLPPAKVRVDVMPGDGATITFRLLGGGGVADAELFSRTGALSPARRMPSALDLLVKLGSADAMEILEPELGRVPGLREALAASWGLGKASLYDRWLGVLARVVELPGPEGPSFEQTGAWSHHLTVAAAGSWAELRHDTLLYVKQPLVWAEGGDGRELPAAKAGGYVEPRPEVFRALEDLRGEVLRWLPQGDATLRFEALGSLLAFLVQISELELANKPIAPEVDGRLREIGKELEGLTLAHGDELPPQAVIADVFTTFDEGGQAQVLEVGIGDVDELWVIVPRDGKRVLMRGGVSAYYEFTTRGDNRLDDSTWQEMLREHRAARPAWATPVSVRRGKAEPPRIRRRTSD